MDITSASVKTGQKLYSSSSKMSRTFMQLEN